MMTTKFETKDPSDLVRIGGGVELLITLICKGETPDETFFKFQWKYLFESEDEWREELPCILTLKEMNDIQESCMRLVWQ